VKTTSNRIVVGVDGSRCSLRALRWALREAKATGSELEVVMVWMDPWSIGGPPTLFGAGREGLAQLKATLTDWVTHAATAEEAESVRVVEHVVAGKPAETLVSRSKDARLLVVGTTGVTGLRFWMLGSVGQRCGQLSHVPVVLVPDVDRQAASFDKEDAGSAPVHTGAAAP